MCSTFFFYGSGGPRDLHVLKHSCPTRRSSDLLMRPWLLPGVVVSFLWAWIFNDSYGVVDHVLSLVGLPGISLLGDPAGAMAAVVIAKTWNSFPRSEEHTSELQSLMRISYAVFCLKKK